MHLRIHIDPCQVPVVQMAKSCRVVDACNARDKGSDQTVGVEAHRGVQTNTCQDDGVCKLGICGNGRVCNVRAEAEAHKRKFVWLSNGTGVRSSADD